MAIGVVINQSSLALTVESTEGTYEAPTAGTDYIEILSESEPFQKNREELSRNTLSGTVEQEESRVGIPEINGGIQVEYRASTTAGLAPQSSDKQLRSLLGGKRTASAQATTTGNTSTVLEFGASPNFSEGDCVVIQEAGAYECRPIASVGATTITLAIALDNGAPSDGVNVEAVTTYYHDTANAPTLSAEYNVGGEEKMKVAGLRMASLSVENFSVGQIPNLNFSAEGVNLERATEAPDFTANFTADALPPVALEACLWIGGNKKSYTELSMNVENTISKIMDACDSQGSIGSRVTDQIVTLTANPYLDGASLSEWNNFEANTDSSAFYYAFNPSTTAGEFSEVVACWIPQSKITELPVGDQEGIATDNLSMKAFRSAGNDTIFMSFI